MKIYVPGLDDGKTRFGGGWSFLDNLKAWAAFEFSEDEFTADVIFIPGATMVPKGYQKPEGKKLVLRIDNALKNSRNRNSGMTRLKDLAVQADMIVYQSKWAKMYLDEIVNVGNKPTKVIINGANESIFKPSGEKLAHPDSNVYLYVRSSNEETKHWHVAWYEFQMIHRKDPKAELWIVGRFSDENMQYNFDFFNGERFSYLGVILDPEKMATIYRSANVLLYPFFNDACSNTLIEALLSHLEVKLLTGAMSGGTHEIMSRPKIGLTASVMAASYKKMFEEVVHV